MTTILRRAIRSHPVRRAGLIEAAGDRLDWPEIAIVAPRRYRLLADFCVEWEKEGFPRQRLIVPAGFECDGASVPAIVEWYLGREKILPAAVPHDWQYAHAGRLPAETHLYLDDGQWKPATYTWSRKEADRFFGRNLRFCDIRSDQRRNAYRAVRLFGWIPWQTAKKRLGATI
jgi:hypothetical protein